MLLLAAFFGMLAGALRRVSFLSRQQSADRPVHGPRRERGFRVAFFFGPRHGVIVRWWRQRSRAAAHQRENTLKSIYHVLEERAVHRRRRFAARTGERRRETVEDAARRAGCAAPHGLATLHEEGNMIFLTPARLAARLRDRAQPPALGTLSDQRRAISRPITCTKMRRRSSTSSARKSCANSNGVWSFAHRDPHGKQHSESGATCERGVDAGPARPPVGYGERRHEFLIPPSIFTRSSSRHGRRTSELRLDGADGISRRGGLRIDRELSDSAPHGSGGRRNQPQRLPGIAIAFLLANSRSSIAMFLGRSGAGIVTTVLIEIIHIASRASSRMRRSASSSRPVCDRRDLISLFAEQGGSGPGMRSLWRDRYVSLGTPFVQLGGIAWARLRSCAWPVVRSWSRC